MTDDLAQDDTTAAHGRTYSAPTLIHLATKSTATGGEQFTDLMSFGS